MKSVHVHSPRRSSRAFSLVELLVVILIIAVIVALALPALSSARNTAKKADTLALCNQLGQAISLYKIDNNGSAPRYYSAADMGHADNLTRGFTEWHNVMLQLMGGVTTATGTGILTGIGPRNRAAIDTTVNVDPSKIGLPSERKEYFKPRAKNFFSDPQLGLVSSEADMVGLPCLIDSWGQPIMVWLAGPAEGLNADPAAQPVGGITPPALAAVTPTPRTAAFYWAANSGVLRSTRLGKNVSDISTQSMLGSPNRPSGNDNPQIQSMIALFGHPTLNNQAPNAAGPFFPTAARGEYIIQSAGKGGVYLAKDKKKEDAGGWTGGDSIIYTPGSDYVSGPNASDDVIVTGG